MRRRNLIAILGGAAFAWPVGGRAQSTDRVRRIGVDMSGDAADPQQQVNVAAFVQGLNNLGWIVGGNLLIDYRCGAADADHMRTNATELVGLKPDVMLVQGAAVPAASQATRTIPIVFVLLADPVSRGVIAHLARPSGNSTAL